MGTWKYASFKSIEANHTPGSMDSKICFVVSILKGNTFMNRFSCRKSRMGRSPPSFSGTGKYFDNNPVSCSLVLIWTFAFFWAVISLAKICAWTGLLTMVTWTPEKVGGRHGNCVLYPFSMISRTQGSDVHFSQLSAGVVGSRANHPYMQNTQVA